MDGSYIHRATPGGVVAVHVGWRSLAGRARTDHVACGPSRTMRRLLLSALLTLVMLAVIGGLLWYGNVDRVAVLVAHFQLSYLIWYLLLLIGYEGIRGVLWLVLLADLRLRVPLATQLFAFAAGEAVRFLPTGAYVQNVLLQRASGADLGRSAAATTI